MEDKANQGSHEAVGVDVEKRATGMLEVVKEMRALKDQLPARPSLEQVQAAEKAVSEKDHQLIKELSEIVEAKRPYGVEPGWFVALQAMREDRCRRDAEMAKRPHMAVLELDDFHRHYETIVMQAEQAIVGGGDGPQGTSSYPSVGSAPRILRYDGGSQLASSTVGPMVANGVEASPQAGAQPIAAQQVTQQRTGGLSAAFKQSDAPASLQSIDENLKSDEAPPKLLAMIEDAVQDNREKFDISDGFGGALTWVPETVGLLSSLTHLDLSGNRLLFLPSSIGNLSNLKILDVYGNDLIDLPETISNLEHLLSLDFHSNKVEELPVSIGGCGELVEINGDFNKLRALPESIGQCVNLQKMSFSLNQLKRLPRTIGSLQQLTDIDLHYNQLEALPDSLCQLSSLTTLNIAAQHVDLQDLPANIGNLESLTELNFSECYIKVLPDSFANLTNLKKLHLQGNPLHDPPISVAEQGKEAIMEYIQSRGPSSSSRSKGMTPKDIEITSSMKRFFRKAGEAVGAPSITRKKSGIPSLGSSNPLSSPSTSSFPSSLPGSGFWGSLTRKETGSLQRQNSSSSGVPSEPGSPAR